MDKIKQNKESGGKLSVWLDIKDKSTKGTN